jgi:type II secretory pathway pseudopilin PulG
VTAGRGNGRRERARAQRRRENVAGERGYTLVETLSSVWILGAVMVSLIGAVLVMTSASDMQRRASEAETELQRLVDAVRAKPYSRSCVTPKLDSYDDAYTKPTSVSSYTLTNLRYWNGTSWSAARVPDLSSAGSNGTCAGDQGIQVFDLTVTIGGAPEISRTQADVVKRENGS